MMPVDPQTQTLLDEVGAADELDYDDLPVEVIRAGLDAVRMPGPRQDVAQVREHEIAGDGAALRARSYRARPGERLPVLVYFHGGGFVSGNLDSHDGICRALANQAECAVLSVAYRLAPEHRFPAATEDCLSAVRWLERNAAELVADPSRVAVGGDSAGGNLAAVTAQLCRDRGGPELRHQLLIYPITDCGFDTPSYEENGSGYLLTRDLMKWFWRQYLPEGDTAVAADDARACPLRAASLAGLAPATVITAEYDPLRDEGERYAERLRQAGVPAELRRFDGQIHGFLTWAGRIDRASEAISYAAARLRDGLGEGRA